MKNDFKLQVKMSNNVQQSNRPILQKEVLSSKGESRAAVMEGLREVLQQCVAAQKHLLDSEDYLRVQNVR